MSALQRPIVPAIVMQHIEEAASLRSTRSVLLRAPHVELLRLARLDERLYAHLDGALLAGDDGYRLAQAALQAPGVGQLFVVAALAIERRDLKQIDRLLALVEALPDATRALPSAFGWVSAQSLRGFTAALLQSPAPLRRWLGIAACAAHRVDAGAALAPAIAADHPMLRASALRAAAQSGRTDLLPAIDGRLKDADPTCRLVTCWAAVLLGDRDRALSELRSLALAKEGGSIDALQLCLLAADPDEARALVRQLAADGAPLRTMIRAAAWAGDIRVVPWLMKQMAEDAHARLAGEAFTWLTGADLDSLALERRTPGQAGGGPSDDPADVDVAMDEDDGLPWPDVDRVKAWWELNFRRLPAGCRCFMGAIADEARCLTVLQAGGQRQRHAAALLLNLMRPGAPLFNIAAPAPRQQRLLASQRASAQGEAAGQPTAG